MSNKLSKEGGIWRIHSNAIVNNKTDLIMQVIYLDRRGEGSEQSASSVNGNIHTLTVQRTHYHRTSCFNYKGKRESHWKEMRHLMHDKTLYKNVLHLCK